MTTAVLIDGDVADDHCVDPGWYILTSSGFRMPMTTEDYQAIDCAIEEKKAADNAAHKVTQIMLSELFSTRQTK